MNPWNIIGWAIIVATVVAVIALAALVNAGMHGGL